MYMKFHKAMNAITISPTELRANQKKYLDMAENTRVFVKRGRKLIELVVKDAIDVNPSPSADPWFDNPENMQMLMERIRAYESKERSGGVTLDSERSLWENIE